MCSTHLASDSNDIIKFYSKSKTHKELSNFSMHTFDMYNTTFVSGEHAFHYSKYNLLSIASADEKRKKELALYAMNFVGKNPKFQSALDAKRAGGRRGKALNDDEIRKWTFLCMKVQYDICLSRLSHSEDLQNILKSTECKYLLHQENRGQAPIWGGRIHKETGKLIGQNKLGLIWMKIRNEMTHKK